eukprot:m.78059 g.78059  ORF g.78059 m.78059 type:complete len:461 (+) comp14729_c0_seq1:276-1658(+)
MADTEKGGEAAAADESFLIGDADNYMRFDSSDVDAHRDEEVGYLDWADRKEEVLGSDDDAGSGDEGDAKGGNGGHGGKSSSSNNSAGGGRPPIPAPYKPAPPPEASGDWLLAMGEVPDVKGVTLHADASGRFGFRLVEWDPGHSLGAVISEVVKGSPADAAGLKVQDTLSTVQGRSVAGESLSRIIAMIQESDGELGLTVTTCMRTTGNRVFRLFRKFGDNGPLGMLCGSSGTSHFLLSTYPGSATDYCGGRAFLFDPIVYVNQVNVSALNHSDFMKVLVEEIRRWPTTYFVLGPKGTGAMPTTAQLLKAPLPQLNNEDQLAVFRMVKEGMAPEAAISKAWELAMTKKSLAANPRKNFEAPPSVRKPCLDAVPVLTNEQQLQVFAWVKQGKTVDEAMAMAHEIIRKQAEAANKAEGDNNNDEDDDPFADRRGTMMSIKRKTNPPGAAKPAPPPALAEEDE